MASKSFYISKFVAEKAPNLKFQVPNIKSPHRRIWDLRIGVSLEFGT
jgi:hypothetical protein